MEFWLIVRLLWDIVMLVVLGFILTHMLRSLRSGAPFIPSFAVRRLVGAAGIRPGDIVYELGCGDGRFSIAAVKAGAARAVGYDISGLVVRLARIRARLSGVRDRCTFAQRDIRTCDPSEATLVFLYLMPELTDTLAAGPLLKLAPGARVLSSCFHITLETHPGFRLLETKHLGFGVTSYLYERV